MTDMADAAQAVEEAERASALARHAASRPARDGECIRCERPMDAHDRRHNPGATTCTRCRAADRHAGVTA